jgi:hypothetical protein
MVSKKYKIISKNELVKDEISTKSHIDNDDYFGTIATILELLKHQLKKEDIKNYALFKKTLLNLKKDLIFLQKNYYIKPRIKNKNNKPKGKLISQ